MLRLVHVAAATLVAGLTLASTAAAADPANVNKARKLAIEAADRLDEKRYQDALDRAKQAEALYHAPTHVLIIAEALEALGQLTEALDVYEKLAAEPLSASAPKAFRVAREKADKQQRALLARVPSVLVRASGPDASAMSLKIDGAAIPIGASTAVRQNPGKHTIEVDAPGWKHAERTVELPDKGGVVTVEIALARASAPNLAEPEGGRGRDGKRIASYVLMGIGGAGLIAGGITGAMSLQRVGELRDACKNNHCTPAQQPSIDSGKTLGTVSTVGFIAGGAVAATGLVLLIVSSVGKGETQKTEPPRASVEPWVGFDAVGLKGRF